jgi:hypothetical protein
VRHGDDGKQHEIAFAEVVGVAGEEVELALEVGGLVGWSEDEQDAIFVLERGKGWCGLREGEGGCEGEE